MLDGSSQVMLLWFDHDVANIRANSAKGYQKYPNMRSRPAVALSIIDPDNPYRPMQLRDKVIDITEPGTDAHIDALANTSLG